MAKQNLLLFILIICLYIGTQNCTPTLRLMKFEMYGKVRNCDFIKYALRREYGIN